MFRHLSLNDSDISSIIIRTCSCLSRESYRVYTSSSTDISSVKSSVSCFSASARWRTVSMSDRCFSTADITISSRFSGCSTFLSIVFYIRSCNYMRFCMDSSVYFHVTFRPGSGEIMNKTFGNLGHFALIYHQLITTDAIHASTEI